VTIAAGFNFDKGILLCADTRHVGGMTLHDSKIFPTEYPSGAKSVIAFAGNVPFARMAIQESAARLARLKSPTKSAMLDAIEIVLLRIHRRHIFKHPDRQWAGGPSFNLLFALWSPLESRASLYATDQTAINEIARYECIGSGDYLGHYIIRPRFQEPDNTLRRTLLVAITALVRIKAYDPDCGGNSEFIVLHNGGALGNVQDFNISQEEEFSKTFHEAASLIYEELTEAADLDGRAAERYTRRLLDVAIRERRQQKREQEARKELMKALLSRALLDREEKK
jgi:20S proteasome alpha/beta subunit